MWFWLLILHSAPLQCFSAYIKIPDPIVITLEHAGPDAQQLWGLMQRRSLPNHHGMLFSYHDPRHISLWSFNCLIDLSIAFLDRYGAVKQISLLKAYPEKMDPLRPVSNLQDLLLYPPGDPIRIFFHEHSVSSAFACNYALEMSSTFFNDQQITVGDVVCWQDHQAYFLKAVDLTPYVSRCIMPLHLNFEEAKPIAIQELKCPGDFVIDFHDLQGKVLKRALFHAKRSSQKEQIPIYCNHPVARISIQRLIPN